MHSEAQRLLGGSPGAVIGKLVALCVVVGAFLSSVRLHPIDLFFGLVRAAHALYDLGAGAANSVLHFFLIGAMVVLPVWLILRFFGYRQWQAEDESGAASRQ